MHFNVLNAAKRWGSVICKGKEQSIMSLLKNSSYSVYYKCLNIPRHNKKINKKNSAQYCIFEGHISNLELFVNLLVVHSYMPHKFLFEFVY